MAYTPAGSSKLSGDVVGIGSGNGTISTTLANVNSNAGTFGSSSTIPILTVNTKGLITSISSVAVGGIFAGSVSIGGSLTVDGSGSFDGALTALTPTTGDNSANVATTSYVNSFWNSKTLSFSGDVSGSGAVTGTITLTLSTIGTAGTYGSATTIPVITLDAHGRVTAITNTKVGSTVSYFYGYSTATTTLSTSSSSQTAIPINTEIRKDTSNYTHASGASTVTILIAGWYEINVELCVSSTGVLGSKGVMTLLQNGNPVNGAQTTYGQSGNGYATVASIHALVQCNTNDTLSVETYASTGGFTLVANNTRLLIKTT